MIADLFKIKAAKKYGYGKALFATQFVPKGTIINFKCKKCGTYSKEELAKLSKKDIQFLMDHEIVEESGLYSKFCDKRLMYDNHSCNANILGTGRSFDSGFGIVVRDIKKEEEATSDYRQGNEEELHFVGGCKCGEKNCMGKSTFRPPAPKKLQLFWDRKTNAALKQIPYVKQPLKKELLKEHPELSYLFKIQELDTRHTAEIDNYVLKVMKNQHVPGLVVGIYHNGDIILAKGYGISDIETGKSTTPDMLFCLGSIGKQFVSAAIMMLNEEGKLDMDDHLTEYFHNSPKSWKKIAIKHLLSHTSGLSEYGSDKFTGPNGLFCKESEFTETELVDRAKKMPILFEPGEKWLYCNTNYMLLGVIIHKITGQFYFDYLKKRIFNPLGMNSPRLVHKSDDINNIATGYELKGKRVVKAEEWSDTFNSTADGVIYCNVYDLAKWDKALYGTKILKQQSLDQLWTVFKLNNNKANPANYGFGWELNQVNGHKITEHTGGWVGYQSDITRYVDVGLTVVVLANLDGQSDYCDVIAHNIAGLLNPELKPKFK